MNLLSFARRSGATLLQSLKKSYVPQAAIALLLLGALLYLTAFPGRDTAARQETVSIYFADNISPAHQKIIDLFNATHASRISVVPINIPFEKFTTNERKELFARFLRSKSNQIDIFAVDGIWIPRFAKWCEPLDGCLTPGERADILPGTLTPCVFQDTLVAVPLFADVALLYYRSDLLGRLPHAEEIEHELDSSITWDRFVEVCRQLRRHGPPPFVFQADNYEGLMCSYVEMTAGLETPLFTGGVPVLTSPAAVQSAEVLRSSVGRDAIATPLVTTFRENNSIAYFLRNNAVFLRGWPSFQRDFASLAPREGVDIRTLRKAPPPHFKGHPAVAMLGGWNLMISKYSTQKPEAIQFLKFLLSKEAQAVLCAEGGLLPVNRQLYEDSSFVAQHPDLRFYRHLLDIGVRRPALANYTKDSDIISRYLKLAIAGTMTTYDALQQAQIEIQADSSSTPGPQ